MHIFGRKNRPHENELLRRFRESRYRLIDTIGEGGLATVQRCHDAHLNRVVALKELKGEHQQNDDLIRSFITEAKLISYLDHPGVISIYDAFLRQKNTLCYTMKCVHGLDIGQAIQQWAAEGRLSPSVPDSLSIFVKLCETLAYVHDRGVLHLDIKPENVMIGRYGEVMIMDWGNARLFDPRPYRDYLAQFSDPNQALWFQDEPSDLVLGTPGYMAPEQSCTPRSQLTPSADIFAAGVLLYEMLTGANPFAAGTVQETLSRISSYNPPSLHAVNPDIPLRLSAICHRMLAKNIHERYPSFQAILTDIRELQHSGQAFVTRAFQTGEIVCQEGDVGSFAFTILAGRVEVLKQSENGAVRLAVLGENEFVGELSVFSDEPRSATVRTIEPTVVLIMDRQAVKTELEKLSPWVERMIAGLSRRFTAQNEKLIRMESEKKG